MAFAQLAARGRQCPLLLPPNKRLNSARGVHLAWLGILLIVALSTAAGCKDEPTAVRVAVADNASPPTASGRADALLSRTHLHATVSECQPCLLETSPGERLEIVFAPDLDGTLSEVGIEPVGGSKRVFRIELYSAPAGQFLLRAVDLNFDGVLDLSMTGIEGTPNASTELFIVDADGARHVGRLTSPRVDLARQQIVSYEKGGHAGLLYRERRFQWRGGELVLHRDVTQTFEEGAYFKTTSDYAGGALIQTVREKVDAGSGLRFNGRGVPQRPVSTG